MKYPLLLVTAAFVLAASFSVEASEEPEEPATTSEVHYIEINPGIIANYNTSGGRPRLLNADITLQVTGDGNAEEVQKHLVPIRHDLIMICLLYTSPSPRDPE